MMNATVEKLVKAVEGRMAPKGYVVSFAETKKNNVGDKSGIQIRKKDSTIGVIVYIDGYIADIKTKCSMLTGWQMRLYSRSRIKQCLVVIPMHRNLQRW